MEKLLSECISNNIGGMYGRSSASKRFATNNVSNFEAAIYYTLVKFEQKYYWLYNSEILRCKRHNLAKIDGKL